MNSPDFHRRLRGGGVLLSGPQGPLKINHSFFSVSPSTLAVEAHRNRWEKVGHVFLFTPTSRIKPF